MRVHADKLGERLSGALAPVYVVSGEEPLQIIETTDAIRGAARAAGFSQRSVFEVESDYDWSDFIAANQSMSLFGDRQLLDVRFRKPPDKAARDVLLACLENPCPDNLLILTLPKLDKKAQGQKWLTVADRLGVVVQVWAVKPKDLGQWLMRRARGRGLVPEAAALELLAERVEGNLLAAAQELDKLLLLYGAGPLTARQVAEAAADSARFNIYDLVDTCLAGDRKRVVRMFEGLRGEGAAAAQVLWWLVKDARVLAAVAESAGGGRSLDGLLARQGVWDSRKALFRKALTSFPRNHWLSILERCAELDCRVKGQGAGNVWDDLLELSLDLCPGKAPQHGRAGHGLKS